ncbi:MAG: DinB family protein [Paludibaculum sp.]
MRIIHLILAMSAIAGLAAAQDSMTDAGAGWAPEFKMAGRQILALAEAMPAEKYAWRPAAGVRSVSEVLMHTAAGNYFFLRSMGVKIGEDLPKNAEKSVTAKADVMRWLKSSFDAVAESEPKIDKRATVKFLGHDATCEGVLLRALAHANEHLGQMIAYARMNGVAPPWSK